MARKKKGGDEEGEQEGDVFEFPDIVFEGPNLDVEPPPTHLPYDQYDDQNAQGLLAANGIGPTPQEIVEALHTQSGVLLAAAAHASGSLAVEAAAPRLRELAQGPDDQAAVEAAFALVRLGEEDAAAVLHQALTRSPDAYLSTVLAANHLARLGDPSGCAVVAAALGSDLLPTRMLACKALLLFVPYHGQGGVDVVGLYERALRDPDPGVQGEAVVQLRWAPAHLARPLLERYLSATDDQLLRHYALDALEHLPDG